MTGLSKILFVILVASVGSPGAAWAQGRPPIIDMHLHASEPDIMGPPPQPMCVPNPRPAWDPARPWAAVMLEAFLACPKPIMSPTTKQDLKERTLAELEKFNVIGVLSADSQSDLDDWRKAAPNRIIPGVSDAINIGNVDAATVERVRAMRDAGEIAVLGEIAPQYFGAAPDDPRLAGFWKMAEELDLPVGIHIGTGPPGAPYWAPVFDKYRARLHSPLIIEDVLVAHPKLRVYLMHAGYPMLDDLLAVLYAHPQVYVDIGVIVYTLPRAEFYRYLNAIMDAGYGNRVMFGSDNMIWPETIGASVEVIEDAPFLTEPQKRAIFYDNAARFLRFDEGRIREHHALGK